MLGPDFKFYPYDLPYLGRPDDSELAYFDPTTQSVLGISYAATLRHGEIIKFLHQAIEWENVSYVMYPYFWTDPDRWDFKQFLHHKDDIHKNFLRAGAARVVLTIRPGFEKSFLSFIETLTLDNMLPADHPYMTIGTEVQTMARTKYPYTEDANAEDDANRVATWFEFTPTGALDVTQGSVLRDS